MYSQNELDEAVAAGALAPDQASSLRAFVASRNRTPTADEEYSWIVRGFNDYFVFYACFFFLVALGWLGFQLVQNGAGLSFSGPPTLLFVPGLFVAAAAWGLAEIFTARRRMATPSWLLAIAFGFGIFFAISSLLATLASDPVGRAVLGSIAALLAAGATWGYWLRFRVPVTPSLAVAFGGVALISLIGAMVGNSSSGATVTSIVALLVGIGVFAYAMRWDSLDPWRVTVRSDIGLWMHLLAAFLIVFPVSYLIGVGTTGVTTTLTAILVILFFLIYAVAGLAVNRKALPLIGVFPLMIVIINLFQASALSRYQGPYYSGAGEGFGGAYGGAPYGPSAYPMGARYGGGDPTSGTFITFLIVSLILLALAIWWSPLRRLVHGLSPQSLRDRVPYVAVARPVEPAPPSVPPAY